jgi:hypothetical protein
MKTNQFSSPVLQIFQKVRSLTQLILSFLIKEIQERMKVELKRVRSKRTTDVRDYNKTLLLLNSWQNIDRQGKGEREVASRSSGF